MGRRKHKNIPRSLVDIIIPAYGKLDFLGMCVEKIPEAADGISYHIYIHDNGSTPEEKSIYRNPSSIYKQMENITIMQNPNPLGFPLACNMIAKKGNSPLMFFLNDDVFLEPGSISELVKELDDPRVGVAGMKLLFPKGTPHGPEGRVQHVGLEMNVRAEVYHQFLAWLPDNPKVLAKKSAMAVTGAALMTRRVIWNKIGGFHLGYGTGTFEDVEYCIQARFLGYNIAISQTAIGYHYVSATAVAHQTSYPLFQNKNLFMSRMGDKLVYEEYKYW